MTPLTEGVVQSPQVRARVLDAEMKLQRAWLELSLRDLSGSMRSSVWSKLRGIGIGAIGASLLKNRSLWLAAISLLMNMYRRHGKKEQPP